MSNSPIWPIQTTLSDVTTPGQGGPGSDGKEEVLRIFQSSSITWILQSDCLVTYLEYSLWMGVLPLSSDTAGVFYSPSRQSCLF